MPGSKFISYQTNKALPWWFNRWVLWKRDVTLEPLYEMDRTIGGGSEKHGQKVSVA